MLFVCHPKILRKHCLQSLLGVKKAPRETENNAYAKFWGDKERALLYVMLFSEVVNWSTPYTEDLDCKNARHETGGKRIVDSQGAHTICLCSRLLYSKCTGFTVCFTYIANYVYKSMINKR